MLKETREKVPTLMDFYSLLAEKKLCVADFPGKILHLLFRDYQNPSCRWELFINGNSFKRHVTAQEWGEIEIDPFMTAVFWNGFLAGMFSPGGGNMACHYQGANIENLLESIKKNVGGH